MNHGSQVSENLIDPNNVRLARENKNIWLSITHILLMKQLDGKLKAVYILMSWKYIGESQMW